LGCFFAHDHPGKPTNFLLGVRYPDGLRHDLGLYESILYLAIAIGLWFAQDIYRITRRQGAAWMILIFAYAVPRFALEFLRVEDTRYLGLTPAQYFCASVVLVSSTYLWMKLMRSRPQPIQEQGEKAIA
jgi:phosphatidylglycerol:prolipoprotein diacylglycerol transferase